MDAILVRKANLSTKLVPVRESDAMIQKLQLCCYGLIGF